MQVHSALVCGSIWIPPYGNDFLGARLEVTIADAKVHNCAHRPTGLSQRT